MGLICFRIPKQRGGFTAHPIFCVACTVAIVSQTKADLQAVEVIVMSHVQSAHA
jgi:hypothetical protein